MIEKTENKIWASALLLWGFLLGLMTGIIIGITITS